jgi:hypothetical protein
MLSPPFTVRLIEVGRELAGLDGGTGANVNLDLHVVTPFPAFLRGFRKKAWKLASLDGASANVDLDLHVLTPFLSARFL